MALPTILPVIITDRTDTLIMLDRTGGTGTGHVAIGATVDFRANTLSRVRILTAPNPKFRNLA